MLGLLAREAGSKVYRPLRAVTGVTPLFLPWETVLISFLASQGVSKTKYCIMYLLQQSLQRVSNSAVHVKHVTRVV